MVMHMQDEVGAPPPSLTYIHTYLHTYLNQSLVCGAQVEERERLRLEALGGEQGVEKKLLDSQARITSSNLLNSSASYPIDFH